MDCEKVRDRFSSLWEKELTPVEKKTIEGHLSSCPACRREFEQFEKTMRWLQSAGEVEVPDGFLPEILKKMEERKRIAPDPKAAGRRFNFPLSLKLPVQAVAMVAVVFLVLYITKMMPMEKYHLREIEQTSPPLSSEKKPEPALTRSAAPPRPELGSKATPISEGEVEKRRSGSTVSEPSPSSRGVEGLAQKEGEKERVALKTSPEGPRPKDLEQAKAPVPKEGRLQEVSVPQVKAEAKRREASAQSTEVLGDQAVESKEAAKVKVPSSEPEKGGKGQSVLERALVASKPPREIVLKTSNREKAISQLHELVRQFGGEIVTKEEGVLIASLPMDSFSEFEKELTELSASTRADKVFAFTRKPDTGGLMAGERAKKEADEKGKRTVKLANGEESRMTVRILLVQE
jgi:hypothetical protein